MVSILQNLSALLFVSGIRLAFPVKKHEALLEDIAVLKCHIDDWNTFHTIVWNKDEQLVVRLSTIDWLSKNGKYNAIRDSDDFLLRILDVQFQDAGVYKCETYYTGISNKVHQEDFELQVQGNPRLFNKETIFTEGDVAVKICCVNITTTFELPKIHWFIQNHDNFESYIEDEREPSTKFSTHDEFCNELSFLSTRRQHGKYLTCLVKNQLNLTDEVILNVLYPASVSLHVSGFHVTESHGFTIKENSAMKITCKSDANPPTNTTLQEKTNSGWNLLRADSSFSFQNETTVINVYNFQNVTRSFSGHYRCVANNSISNFSVGTIEVLYSTPLKKDNQSGIFFIFFILVVVISAFTVTVTVLIYNRKLSALDAEWPILAFESGSVAHIPCMVRGETKAYFWRRGSAYNISEHVAANVHGVPDEFANATQGKLTVNGDGSLAIYDISPEDDDTYFCRVVTQTSEHYGGVTIYSQGVV
ncbi:Cell adhesion molecule 2 [Holothuria leucospilota]|uniref:Cell adhesion molecule 2 n=1 Tax=Holothuria leucospilota TaxID=206669 RepID=A0A9Q1BYQ4_HOLLE|nr:Cell adhesion molecule 2 [Holothuria leucospilota]